RVLKTWTSPILECKIPTIGEHYEPRLRLSLQPFRARPHRRPQCAAGSRTSFGIRSQRFLQACPGLEAARRGRLRVARRRVQQLVLRMEEKARACARGGSSYAHFVPVGHLQIAAYSVWR